VDEYPTDILLVEHDVSAIDQIQQAFAAAGRDVCWRKAATLAEARQLQEPPPALMLLADDLPDGSGEGLLPGPFKMRRFPIILMARQGSEQQAIDSIKQGALHYVVKSEEAMASMAKTAAHVLQEWRLIEQHRALSAELLASEARFRHFLETLRDIAFIIDGEGSITYANTEAGKVIGVPALDLQGKRFSGYLAEGERQKADEAHRRVLAGETVELEVEFLNGRFFNVKCEPQLDSSGEIIGICGIGRDVSEQRQALLALEQSELQLRTILDTAVDGMLVADAQTRKFVVGNPAICQMLGYEMDELMQLGVEDIHPAEALAVVKQQFEQQLRGENRVAPELPVRRKDGTVFYADISSAPLTISGRSLLLGVFHDVTERKEAEAKIRLLSSAIEQIDEAVLITDRKGIIEYVNPAFTAMTGFTVDDAIGRNANIINSGLQDTRFFRHMWHALRHRKSWRSRIVNRRSNGSFYPCLLTISPIEGEEGKIDHYVGVQQDLKSYEDLEAQFLQSQKMEAIGVLVGGIAHDFNNALAGITGNVYLAHKDLQGQPEVAERLEAIETLADRTAGMIRQLLTFSRKGKAEMRPLGIDAFLREVIKLQRVSVPENIRLQYESGGETMEINGDANVLQQVIINLINNARDALLEAAAPAITIRLAPFTADGHFQKRHHPLADIDYVRLTISDNGQGIAPEHIKHLFEPFFTTKGVGKGTGLGLSMAYGAVQAHNGVIEVDSRQGEGTTFAIYLPRLDTGGESGGGSLGRGEKGEIARGHGETILLADDNEDLLNMGRDVLRHLGYRVLTASDGEQAVDLFRQEQDAIDLLLLDMVMPKLGGIEVLRVIRSIKPDAKILFATGYDMGNALEQGEEVDAAMLITKPFAISELSRVVRRCLEA